MGNAWYKWDGEDLLLQVRIQPKASRDEFAGPYDDCFKIRITAPPVDGKANQHLMKLLAKQFGVTRDRVILIRGQTSKTKMLRIVKPEKIPLAIEQAF